MCPGRQNCMEKHASSNLHSPVHLRKLLGSVGITLPGNDGHTMAWHGIAGRSKILIQRKRNEMLLIRGVHIFNYIFFKKIMFQFHLFINAFVCVHYLYPSSSLLSPSPMVAAAAVDQISIGDGSLSRSQLAT